MKHIEESKTTDVSKGLFMDLAFLLIAALVLLVQEPVKDAGFAFSQIRSSFAKKLIEKDIPGESLFLLIEKGGSVFEITFDGEKIPLPLNQLEVRIDAMDKSGERVVVLNPESDSLYVETAKLRDLLTPFEKNGTISRIYETVAKEAD